MKSVWRKALKHLSDADIDNLLKLVPKKWRKPPSFPTAFKSERSYLYWLKKVNNRLSGGSDIDPKAIKALVDGLEVFRDLPLPKSLIKKMQNEWSIEDFEALGKLKKGSGSLGDEAPKFAKWLMVDKKLDFPRLRKHFPDLFDMNPVDGAVLKKFQADFEVVRKWNPLHIKFKDAAGNPTVKCSDSFEWGRTLERRAREEMGKVQGSKVVDVDAVSTKRVKGDEWHYSGKDYAAVKEEARNFPSIDTMELDAAGNVKHFGQITHGGFRHLEEKLYKLLGFEPVGLEHLYQLVEELQFLKRLPKPGPGKTSNQDLLRIYFKDYLPKVRLYIPEQAVNPLKAILVSNKDFMATATNWANKTGRKPEEFLNIIAKIGNAPP